MMGRILDIPYKDTVAGVLEAGGFMVDELNLRKTSRGDLSITGNKAYYLDTTRPLNMDEAFSIMNYLRAGDWSAFVTSYTKKAGPMTWLAYRVTVEGRLVG